MRQLRMFKLYIFYGQNSYYSKIKQLTPQKIVFINQCIFSILLFNKIIFQHIIINQLQQCYNKNNYLFDQNTLAKKCKLQNDHCLECLDLNHDLINNKCVYKFGFRSSGIEKLSCSLCEYPRLYSSISVNTCLSCFDTKIFQLEHDKCVFKQDYFQQGTDCSEQCLIDNSNNCLQCQLPSLTCVFNQDFCTSCQDNQSLVEGQCMCEESDIIFLIFILNYAIKTVVNIIHIPNVQINFIYMNLIFTMQNPVFIML
ncbi:unnamed protein product [Paramecium sonneborni]|uniref:Transmembrane protein n=1 Tax=Paramecium sonneborni TaxID=65129 RepID=A0A8S1RSJ4_9CILI|nr:unnamed protein product [Paramecium sonneborni]